MTSDSRASPVLQAAVGLVANVTVLTALLVYFGWRRSQTHARRLGIDESVLGMSARDYALRSVGPVLLLLVGIGVCGLAWAAVDRRLAPHVLAGRKGADVVVRLLAGAWLVLPLLVVALGWVWPIGAFVLFPVGIAVGVLLHLYAAHLRESTSVVLQASVAVLVGVCLFWTASNYAEVLGVRLADQLALDGVASLPGVVVYSETRLHLDGPGVVESDLGAETGAARYRYNGLRLLEHTGGRYFLISDAWTMSYGVVFVVRDDDPVRLDLVRDLRP